MKKYLLGLLVIPFSLIAFSNAETINFSCSDGICSPNTITLNSNLCVGGESNLRVSNTCENTEEDTDCTLALLNGVGNCGFQVFSDTASCFCDIEGDDEFFINNGNEGIFNGTLIYQGNSGGGDDNTGGGVISDGFGSFTPVITGVKDTIFQLIPLVVYIGIGVLIVTLGFFAIRWLVNWIVGKVNSNFSSKRD